MRPPTLPLAPRSFPAGVERAIETVAHASRQRGRPECVRGRPRRVAGKPKGPIFLRGEVVGTVPRSRLVETPPGEAMNRDWT
jgi:hypothetical protein